jgi:hypothetical protein
MPEHGIEVAQRGFDKEDLFVRCACDEEWYVDVEATEEPARTEEIYNIVRDHLEKDDKEGK